MHEHAKRILVLSVGIIFLILGVFGLVLPIFQGLFFLFIGIILLSLYSPTIRKWMEIHTTRYPKLHTIVEKVEHWIVKIIGKP